MSMKVTDLQAPLVHELKDLSSAERQVLKALPELEGSSDQPSSCRGVSHAPGGTPAAPGTSRDWNTSPAENIAWAWKGSFRWVVPLVGTSLLLLLYPVTVLLIASFPLLLVLVLFGLVRALAVFLRHTRFPSILRHDQLLR